MLYTASVVLTEGLLKPCLDLIKGCTCPCLTLKQGDTDCYQRAVTATWYVTDNRALDQANQPTITWPVRAW